MSNLFKKYFPIFVFLINFQFLFGQEVLRPLNVNSKLFTTQNFNFQKINSAWYPKYIYGITDTLILPFIDDFSSNKFPDFYYYSYLPQNRSNAVFHSRKVNNIVPTNPIIEYSTSETFTVDSTVTPVTTTTNTAFTISYFSTQKMYPESPFVEDSIITAYPPYNVYISPNGIDNQILSGTYRRDSLITDTIYSLKLGEKNANWLDYRQTVFLNNSMPINPPSIGVATFDGLKNNGMPYNFSQANSFGPADTLTSKPINLNYSSNPGVYMIFFFQPGGRGNIPEFEDSLTLEFKAPGIKWQRVWGQTGYDPGTDTNFKKIVLHIDDTAFLKNAFQFRFRNYATLSGNLDHWNLDYIQISADPNDTIINDAAFVYPIKSLITPYTSIPFDQYSSSNMLTETQNYIRNLSNTDINLSYRFRLSDYFQTSTFSSFDVDNINFYSNSLNNCELCSRVLNPLLNLGYQFPINTECTEYKIKQFIQPLAINSNKNNDTIVHIQRFADYFSYDDGSAEAAYGVENSPLAEVLCEFELTNPATLSAVRIHFSPSLIDVSEQDFSIMIRTKNSITDFPGDSVYEQVYQVPQYSYIRDGFVEYPLNSPISIAAGKIYIGFKQYYNTPLNIGFDKNNNHYDKTFFRNFGGTWYNSQFEGSLMIRPVFNECVNGLPSPISEVASDIKNEVFPNPANNFIIVPKGNYAFYDLLGRECLIGNNQYEQGTIDISQLNEGIYLIKINNNNTFANQKIIIKR